MSYNADYEFMMLHRALVEKDHIGVFLSGFHFTNKTLGSIWDELKDDDTGDIIELSKTHDEALLHEILDQVTSNRYSPNKLAAEIVRNYTTQIFIKELDLVKGLVIAGMEPEAALKQLSCVDIGNASSSEPKKLHKVLSDNIKEIGDIMSGDKECDLFIETGIDCFDRAFFGIERAAYTVIAARPSMGKTAWAIKVATNIALTKKKVLIISLEMTSHAIGYRIMSSAAKLDLQLLRRGKIENDASWTRLSNSVNDLSKAEMYIDDTPALTINQLRAKIMKHYKRHGLDVVVIDYMGLMTSENKNEKKHEYISAISNAMPGIAKETNAAVCALSQLGREVERRIDKRPMMSDLRDSGSVEQDADAIIMLYRDEYYNKKPANEGVAEIIVQKQRNGPTGTVLAAFDKEHASFGDIDPEKQERYMSSFMS